MSKHAVENINFSETKQAHVTSPYEGSADLFFDYKGIVCF
jgi:hypothetical protein